MDGKGWWMSMQRIAQLRKDREWTQAYLAGLLHVDQTTVSLYESDKGQPDAQKLRLLAQLFHVSADYLLELTDYPGLPEELAPNYVPVYARLTVAPPDTAPVGYEYIPVNLTGRGRSFVGLRLADDSMAPRFLAGDTVIIQRGGEADAGSFVLLSVEQGEAVLRRYLPRENGVLFQALNPEAETLFFTPAERRRLPVSILGTVVQTIRR